MKYEVKYLKTKNKNKTWFTNMLLHKEVNDSQCNANRRFRSSWIPLISRRHLQSPKVRLHKSDILWCMHSARIVKLFPSRSKSIMLANHVRTNGRNSSDKLQFGRWRYCTFEDTMVRTQFNSLTFCFWQ